MRRYRLVLAVLMAIVLCMQLPLSTSAEMAPPYLQSEAAILMDADSGQILYEKNSRTQMYPASITKIMTGMLALTYLNPGDTITISEEAYNSVPRTSSHIGLQAGEELRVDQAMYALAMQSANDAANGLAEAVSGSTAAFAQLMTETAHALGAEATQFTNANGLPDKNHYTTAYDMALITAQALKTQDFCKYFSTINYHMLPTNKCPDIRTFVNPNQILADQYAYSGVIMSKTGWTSAAWGTLVTACRQGDTTLIAVVLRSQYMEGKYQDTCALFDYGFSQFRRVSLTGETLAEKLPVEGLTATQGQVYSFLLPAQIEESSVSFSVSGAPDLSAVTSRTEITVTADAGDWSIPAFTLQLQRPAPQQNAPLSAPQSQTSAPQQAPVPQETAAIPWLLILIAVLSVSLILAAVLILRRKSLRVPV